MKSKGIFITATGTDVGKTYVTALLVKKLREEKIDACYFKAALSGVKKTPVGFTESDAGVVKRIANLQEPIEELVPYIYEEAVSPHLAAKWEENPVELSVVKEAYHALEKKHEFIVVEGSGGIVCPLRYDQQILLLEDVVVTLGLDTIVIAKAGLGTINETVLTVSYLKQKGITVKGIILNHFHVGNLMEEDNLEMIEKLTNIPVIAVVQENATECVYRKKESYGLGRKGPAIYLASLFANERL